MAPNESKNESNGKLKGNPARIDKSSHTRATKDCTIEASKIDECGLLYELEDSPGWILSSILGIQHCLLAVGGLIGMPLVFAHFLCMHNDPAGTLGVAKLINSMLFISGIASMLQTTLGVRLPIMQGASAAFTSSIIAILSLPHNKCPSAPLNETTSPVLYNDTDGRVVDSDELWQRRMREVQGALIVSSCFEMFLAMTGIAGRLLRYVGPLVVAPSITLIGLSLVEVAGQYASGHWGIAAITFTLLVVFSQYLKNLKVPLIFYKRSTGFYVKRSEIFKLFSVLISIIIACVVAWIFTVSGVLPEHKDEMGYRGRTDLRLQVLQQAPWFRIPYPGQWGMPIISAAGTLGTSIAVIVSMVESTGDYIACAKTVHAPSPPISAFNRGLAMEGFGSLLAATVGTSTALTSYTQNVAAIEITRVGSRRVLQAAGIAFFLMGMIGKFGAMVVIIPDPVIGGLFCVMFGMIGAIGMSNLQYVDMNSSRNLFIMGFSVFMGLCVPDWSKSNPGSINTGYEELDQTFSILLENELIIGFLLAVFLDNTLPGTLEERGMTKWMNKSNSTEHSNTIDVKRKIAKSYNLPFKTSDFRLSKYIPFLPEYDERNNKDKAEFTIEDPE